MLKHLLTFLLTSVMLFAVNTAFATSIETATDQSAKYWVNSARYASTDGSADIVYYNPAGTAFMPEGLYLNLSSQTLIMPYKQKVEMKAAGFSESYSQNNPVPSLPNFYLSDNIGKVGIGNLAFFCNAGIIAGGGNLEWDGTAGTAANGFALADKLSTSLTEADIDFSASAAMYQLGGGVAYSLNDVISLSTGARYVIARKEIEMKAGMVLEMEHSWMLIIKPNLLLKDIL